MVGINNSVENAFDSDGQFDPNLLVQKGTSTAT